MKFKNLVFCLFFVVMIDCVSAISSTDGIWGGYDDYFVYSQYCNGTVFQGFGSAHIRIYENKTGETSCNPGYHGTRFSFVVETYTPGNNNLFYGLYNQCGFPPVLNPYRYNTAVYFYADNTTNRSGYSFPYGVYSAPQLADSNHIACSNNNTCVLRADAQSICYQNNYNTSFVNGTYESRLYFLADNTEGIYPPNIDFLDTGFTESINNSVYGNVFLDFSMFEFNYVSSSTTTTTTTTISTSSTIPIYTIDVSVNQSLGLDMTKNLVGLFHCETDEQYAALFVNPNSLPSGCSNDMGIWPTDEYGNTSFIGMVGGVSYYVISVFPGTSYIDGVIIPSLISNVSISLDYSGFVSSLYAIDFFEKDNANVVVNVSYSIRSTSGNFTPLVGSGSSVRWNNSKLNGYYTISANALGYQPLTDGSNLFVLRNLWQGKIDKEYLVKSTIENNNYSASGRVLNNSGVLNNVRVDLSCSLSGGNVVYTNTSGYWSYNKFALHDECSISSDNGGLCEREVMNFEVIFNNYLAPTILLDSCADSIIKKEVLNFIVWKEVPSLTSDLSTWDYFSNVRVVVNCDNGISKTSELTDNYGHTSVRVDDGSVCRYSVSGISGYVDAPGSVDNNPQEIKMFSTMSRSCYIFGLCKYDNIGRLCSISLIRDGKSYYTGFSDTSGNYNIPVECGFNYLVSAHYLNCTGYSSMTSVSQGESGSFAADVNIPICNSVNPNESSDFNSFLSSLVPMGELIILGFFVYVLVSVWGRE